MINLIIHLHNKFTLFLEVNNCPLTLSVLLKLGSFLLIPPLFMEQKGFPSMPDNRITTTILLELSTYMLLRIRLISQLQIRIPKNCLKLSVLKLIKRK